MDTLQHFPLSRLGSVTVLAFGLAVSGCNDEGSETADDQVGAAPEEAQDMEPGAGVVPESEPAAEDPGPELPAE